MATCNENIEPIVFSDEIATENIKKKYGLSPINNINPVVEICPEIFRGPTYYTNLTKIITGLTETSEGVFNLSNSGMTANFNFTGNTETLSAYTGSFYYNIYSRNLDLIPPQFNEPNTFGSSTGETFSTSITYSASTHYSAITSNSNILNENFSFLNSGIDQEYILNSNNGFVLNNCSFKGEFYTENNLGSIYNADSSWYFVTLVNPPTPTLGPFKPPPRLTPSTLTVKETTNTNFENKQTYVFDVPQKIESSNGCKLINETLEINPPSSNLFTISKVPSPDTLLVSVNGITLSNSDYSISADTIIVLTETLEPNRDIIVASYLDCETNLDTVYSEKYEILSAITSGTTSAVTTSDKVYYNTEKNKYEYYLDYTPEEAETTMSLFLNGIKLTYGVDYYMSISVANRVIFNSITLSISDIIYIVYTSDGTLEGDYEVVVGNSSLGWKSEPAPQVNDRLSGEFIVEITESNDPNFTSTGVTTGITASYVSGINFYSVGLPPTIEANKSYIWRVNSKKVYSGILDNIFITRNISRVGRFSTNNKINSY